MIIKKYVLVLKCKGWEYNNFKELLENQEAYNAMAKACNPYGDGHACERIADILEGKEYQEWVAE